MLQDAKRILVPVNGNAAGEWAFRDICRMARTSKAEIHVIYVIEVPLELPLDAQLRQENVRGEAILSRIEAIADEEKWKVRASILQARQAGPAIITEAEERYMDLIVLGISHRRRVGMCPLGPTANHVFKYASCQVILWRERETAAMLR